MARKEMVQQEERTREQGSKGSRGRKKSAPATRSLVPLELIAVEKLLPADYNPRKALQPGDPEFEKLRRSISKFGMVESPVWNKRSGKLVGGHQRVSVAKALGYTELQCSVVDLSEAEEKALNIALNKIEGEWDDAKLAGVLAELKALEDFDETLSGFDADELDKQIAAAAADLALEDTSPQLGGMVYRVVVDCENEAHQRRLLERFNKENLPCRALIS